MPLLPLVGHHAIRARIDRAVRGDKLPASLLLQGPAGGGKERLALWMAERILCAAPTAEGEPCRACQHCSYVSRGAHPDLLWFFPRPKLKDTNPDRDDIMQDLAEAAEERTSAGAWDAPEPTDAIYLLTVQALLGRALLTPALAQRKVIVMGDAHRMAPQESMEEASNAFLKLLEEPLADTTIILTTSQPSALLPTIRSRVVSVRVPPLSPDNLAKLASLGVKPDAANSAQSTASALLDAAGRDAVGRYRAGFPVGASGARGAFSDTLDALVRLLHERARAAAVRGDERTAANAARGLEVVERTKLLTRTNVNPQLLTVTMLEELSPLVS